MAQVIYQIIYTFSEDLGDVSIAEAEAIADARLADSHPFDLTQEAIANGENLTVDQTYEVV